MQQPFSLPEPMDSQSTASAPVDALVFEAVVSAAHQEKFVVRSLKGSDTSRLVARAASCLLMPEPGDRVVVMAGHIASVTERKGEHPPKVILPAGSVIQTTEGRLGLASKEGVDIVGGQELNLLSERVSVQANQADFVTEALSFVGKKVRAELDHLQWFARAADSVVDRIVSRAKRSYRRIDEMDQTHAGQVDVRAKSTMTMHADTAMMTAKELVKVDGGQIHFG